MQMKIFILISGLFVGLQLFAQKPKPTPFANGDRVCFIGNSITQGSYYTNFIQLFYATRFPDRVIQFYDCGIAGASGYSTLNRFDWDVMVNHPTKATLKLGMNDVNSSLYKPGPVVPHVDSLRHATSVNYKKNIVEILNRLKAGGCGPVTLLSPSLYDQTAHLPKEKNFGVNDELKQYGLFLDTLANDWHMSYVDLNNPMDSINRLMQKSNPSFTIVGPDRVHPGKTGHLFMAYLFLKQQGISPFVSSITINAHKKSIDESLNCSVKKLKASHKMIQFQNDEKSLPFPLLDVDTVKTFFPMTEKLNQQIVRVKNLYEGLYTLSIDNIEILKATSEELSNGINLSIFVNTPQYKQALKVKEITDSIFIVNQKIRSIAFVESSYNLHGKTFTGDSARIFFENHLSQNPWVVSQCEQYLLLKPREDELKKKLKLLHPKLYLSNKPKAHHYLIEKI